MTVDIGCCSRNLLFRHHAKKTSSLCSTKRDEADQPSLDHGSSCSYSHSSIGLLGDVTPFLAVVTVSSSDESNRKQKSWCAFGRSHIYPLRTSYAHLVQSFRWSGPRSEHYYVSYRPQSWILVSLVYHLIQAIWTGLTRPRWGD